MDNPEDRNPYGRNARAPGSQDDNVGRQRQGPYSPAPPAPQLPPPVQPPQVPNVTQAPVTNPLFVPPGQALYGMQQYNNNIPPPMYFQPPINFGGPGPYTGLQPINNPVQQVFPPHVPQNINPPPLPQPPPAAPRMDRPSNITQRITNAQTSYGQLLQGKPPVNVQPPLNINIGIIEICTFFPNWFQIPEVIVRAVRNDWARRDLAKAQLWPDNQLTRANCRTAENRIQKQISEGGNIYNGYEKARRFSVNDVTEHVQDDDLTANGWQLRAEHDINQRGAVQWEHIPLADIYTGIPAANWPQGRDRLVLTRCLEYASANPQFNLDTSHWNWIIQTGNFVNQLNLNGRHDKRALNDLGQRVQDP